MTATAVLLPRERRQFSRLHVTIPAFAHIHDGVPMQPCTVLDISENGGRVRVDAGPQLPDNFVLLFNNTGTVRRDCRVIWRQENYLGVEFHNRFDFF